MRGRGSVNSDEFIREVDEAVRQEQWQKLWKQYGSYIVAAALALVVGSAAAAGWRTWQENRRLDDARRYAARSSCCARTSPRRPARRLRRSPRTRTAAIACSPGCARLRPGRGPAGAAATAALEQLASNADNDPVYRSLGELLAAQRDFANAQPDALLAQLEPLAGIDDPWRYSALELRALAQMKSGDTAAARQTLDDLLADPLTPPHLGRRAAELLAFLGGPPAAEQPAAQAGQPAAEATEQPAPAPAQEGSRRGGRLMGRGRCALAALIGLAACSSDDSWFGSSDDPPLPGERVSVMLLEREVNADPASPICPSSYRRRSSTPGRRTGAIRPTS